MAYTESNGETLPTLVAKRVVIVPGQTYSFSQLFTLDLGLNPDPNIIGITYQIYGGPYWTFSGWGTLPSDQAAGYQENTGPDALNYAYFSPSRLLKNSAAFAIVA
jgi:hypothetical protein